MKISCWRTKRQSEIKDGSSQEAWTLAHLSKKDSWSAIFTHMFVYLSDVAFKNVHEIRI
jgi:hypothetical protein